MAVDLEKLQKDVADTRQMVQILGERLNTLIAAPTTSIDTETPLNAQQAADFLSVSRQTVYQNKATIPRHKRHGKLYFFKADLLAYLKKEA